MPTSTGNAPDGDAVVDRVLAGETDAFEEIVHRWQVPLVNLAYRFCGDRSMAEEMAQEAFLDAFRNLGRWRRESRFSTWLFSVALNRYRKTMRRHVPQTADVAELEEALPAGDLADEMDAAAEKAVVRRAVRLLPPDYRDTVIAYYFLQQDVAETARSLGSKEGTVKARLHRARKLLEQKLRALKHPRALRSEEA